MRLPRIGDRVYSYAARKYATVRSVTDRPGREPLVIAATRKGTALTGPASSFGRTLITRLRSLPTGGAGTFIVSALVVLTVCVYGAADAVPSLPVQPPVTPVPATAPPTADVMPHDVSAGAWECLRVRGYRGDPNDGRGDFPGVLVSDLDYCTDNYPPTPGEFVTADGEHVTVVGQYEVPGGVLVVWTDGYGHIYPA